jgi:hypothetical protein
MLDPARLYATLLNTGLQQKDPALYQLIRSLIGEIVTLSNTQTATSTASATPVANDSAVIMARVILDN